MTELCQRFTESKIGPSQDHLVIFNDFGDIERDPETATSQDDALARILSWPALGGLEFELKGYPISLFLLGIHAGHVDALSLSVLSSAYMHEQLRSAYDRLIEELHRTLGATRTISGGNLLSPGSWWLEELERVRRGVLAGQYSIDLRRP